MSILRSTGTFVALAILLTVFLRLRRHKAGGRHNTALFMFFGMSLLMISLFPGLLNIPTEIFSLNNYERGRLLMLLIASNFFLWILLIYERSKNEQVNENIDKLIRSLAAENFFNCHDSFACNCILVIIPAYNEEDNIGEVISSLPDKIHGRELKLLVIDDGSNDRTSDVCEERGVWKARNLINRGGGASLRVGYDIAFKIRPDAIVTMDGDGQHQAEDLPALVEPVLKKEADLVIGSRRLGSMEKYSALRYYGVIVFGYFISFLIGKKISDPASGFRAISPEILKRLKLKQDQYHTPELIIEAAKHGFCIKEIPVTIKKRLSGTSKKGKDLKYAMFFLKSIIRSWLR